jgi:sulfite oxidase
VTCRANPQLIVHSRKPYNAEPPLDRLRASFITAQSDFYIRSHGNIPELQESTHRLRVGGKTVARPLDLSMAELRDRFPARTVTAVMQCAGNRRADMLQVRPVLGDPWAPGAIGNAVWTGVALADVLRAAGAPENSALHVALTACDECEAEGEQFCYAVSIPMAKALCPDVLLAYEMNGEPLAPEHGFPLRAVVPGFAGVRSPKWLAAVTVLDQSIDCRMQARDYKLFPSDVTQETADWEQGVTINELPLNSAICEPAPYAQIASGLTTVRGWAIATGRAIVRVDVSCDGGRTWRQAGLERNPDAPWSWTFWQAEFDLPQGDHDLVVRAWDSAGQTQPALPDEVWNFRGYLSAAWHRVPICVR